MNVRTLSYKTWKVAKFIKQDAIMRIRELRKISRLKIKKIFFCHKTAGKQTEIRNENEKLIPPGAPKSKQSIQASDSQQNHRGHNKNVMQNILMSHNFLLNGDTYYYYFSS